MKIQGVKKAHILIVIIALSLGALVLLWPSQTKFVVVDSRVLVKTLSQKLQQKGVTADSNPGHMSKAVEAMRAELNHYAQQNNLIVLAKNTVLAGDLPDHTKQIHTYLFKVEP